MSSTTHMGSDTRTAGFYWRAFGFSLMYPLFAVGCIVMLAAYPLICLGGREARQARMRRMARRTAKTWLAVARGLGILSYDIYGSKPSPGTLVVSNHPTLIDIILLLSYLPETCCVLKGDLARLPVLKQLVGILGWIANDDPEVMLAESAAALDRGEVLLVFPEATRSVPGQTLDLKRGAAEIAARASCRLQTVAIRYAGTYLSKSAPWHAFPADALYYDIEFATPQPVPADGQRRQRRQRRRLVQAMLERYFQSALN